MLVTDDAKVWTFNLREGVKFNDGTPFNAEAAKFALEMHKRLRPKAAVLITVEEVYSHIPKGVERK